MERYEQVLKKVNREASAPSFIKYVANSAQNKGMLIQSIKKCSVDEIKMRFNIWGMVLGVYGMDSSIQQKIQELNASRQHYKTKKSQALSGLSTQNKQSKIPKNPLMAMMKNSKTQKTSNDELLREDIKKDVERTYQDMEFFRNQNILKLLTVVLLVWCKRNPVVSYQQGMNQVLASVVYVYFKTVFTPGREPEGYGELSEREQELYILFNSIEHIQADIYNVFEKIMNVQHQMYKTQADSTLKGVINPNSKNNTPILQRIITLIDHKLKFLDIQLFRTLKLQDVQTKSFLLRWIRCMHTRQFSLESSFLIWDSIFLDYHETPKSKYNSFEFIDSMCLAMFVYMRKAALVTETAYGIQQIYQKYPSLKKGGDLEELIGLAWSLCEALKNPTQESSGSSIDWPEQQSIQNNSVHAHQGKQDQIQNEPQPPQTRIHETPITKQQQTPENIQNNLAIESSNPHPQQQPSYSSVTLTHTQCSSLHDNLSSSIHLTNQSQVREHLQNCLHILHTKIKEAKANIQLSQ